MSKIDINPKDERPNKASNKTFADLQLLRLENI